MKNKKTVKWEWLIFLCIVSFILICVCLGRMSFTPGSKFIALSPFGRLELLGVDKAVITIDGESVTVTDAELLGRIVDETTIANEAYSCEHGSKDRSIDLYRGDKLVRSMKWYDCTDFVRVYDADLIHWLFPPEAQAGYAELSRDLVRSLEALF